MFIPNRKKSTIHSKICSLQSYLSIVVVWADAVVFSSFHNIESFDRIHLTDLYGRHMYQ